jgi:hypothetical protein
MSSRQRPPKCSAGRDFRRVRHGAFRLGGESRRLAQVKQGKVLAHEEVGVRLERKITEKQSRP